ncbi:MAG: hypothetical protein R3F61_27290 [Myxococcota bacterium]
MIALLTAAWAGSAGLYGGPLAYRGPVRHDLRPAFGVWGRAPVGPLQLTGELLGAWRSRASLEHRVILGRASVLAGVGTGGERAHVGIGLGPALVVRTGSAGPYAFTAFSPAVRAATHFDLHLGRLPLAARYQLGTTVRAARAWDFDVAIGLGAWW